MEKKHFFSEEQLELKSIEQEIEEIKNYVVVADKLVEEGNKLLKVSVKKMNHAIFTEDQPKIKTGLKCKVALASDLETTEKKMKNLLGKGQQPCLDCAGFCFWNM